MFLISCLIFECEAMDFGRVTDVCGDILSETANLLSVTDSVWKLLSKSLKNDIHRSLSGSAWPHSATQLLQGGTSIPPPHFQLPKLPVFVPIPILPLSITSHFHLWSKQRAPSHCGGTMQPVLPKPDRRSSVLNSRSVGGILKSAGWSVGSGGKAYMHDQNKQHSQCIRRPI